MSRMLSYTIFMVIYNIKHYIFQYHILHVKSYHISEIFIICFMYIENKNKYKSNIITYLTFTNIDLFFIIHLSSQTILNFLFFNSSF